MFAQNLENNEAVKVYTKLPGWFTVPPPRWEPIILTGILYFIRVL